MAARRVESGHAAAQLGTRRAHSGAAVSEGSPRDGANGGGSACNAAGDPDQRVWPPTGRGAREGLTGLGEEEDARVIAIVNDWAPPQAVANLLMYPEVLPEEVRHRALTRGLTRPYSDYAVLAAVVGVQHLADVDPPSGEQRADLLAAGVPVAAHAGGVLAARALVALVALSRRAGEELAALAEAGRVSEDDVAAVRRRLDELGGRLPPLAYIPNYDEWDGG